jgi:signal transduction histidine kinase
VTDLPPDTLRRILDAGQAIVAHLDLETVLDHLLETAREVTGARYAAIGVLNEQRTGLARFVTRGVDEETHRAIGDLPRGRGVLGILVQRPQALRLADVGRHPESYGFPAAHPPMKTFLGMPIMIRDEAWGNVYLTEKAGGEEFSEADEEAIRLLSGWAAIAIENARLYADLALRRNELERAVRGLEATTDIAKAVGSETELVRILELIVKRGRALVEARAVVLLLAEGADLVVASSAGQVASTADGSRIPIAGTATGDVYRAVQPERIEDVPERLSVHEEALGVVGAQTGLIVPLIYRGISLGVLAAFDHLGEEAVFGREHERLLAFFASSAATAVATAQTVQRERLRHSLEAAEQERRRWARELHDETLQGLAGLQMLLSSYLRQGDPAALEGAVSEAVAQLAKEIANLRMLITELRPAALDELGLEPAIESLAKRLSDVEGIEVDVDVHLGGERLGGELETTVYRIVQEALTNVAKHAGASRAVISVVRDNGQVQAEVRDNGRGIDLDSPSGGFGLVGMRERAALHDGSVDIAPGERGGTTVIARFPV